MYIVQLYNPHRITSRIGRDDPDLGMLAYYIYAFATFLPSLAVAIRDFISKQSGWMILVSLIPFIGEFGY